MYFYCILFAFLYLYVIAHVYLLAQFFIYTINRGQAQFRRRWYAATGKVHKWFTARKWLEPLGLGDVT